MCCYVVAAIIALFCGPISNGDAAAAAVMFDNESRLSADLHIPAYEWGSTNTHPRIVILALHGFMFHGGAFDTIARHLADKGAIVIAPDMRGFGRWYHAAERWPGGKRIDYRQSEQDAVSLLRKLRAAYPHIPIVCLGESMGANLSVSLAATHPELVDGLILSSPCIIKRRTLMRPRIIGDIVIGIACPWWQNDLIPYAKRYVSEKSLRDPLVRRRIHAWEVLHTLRGLKATLRQASGVAAKTPVLLLRGSNDQLCKYEAIDNLSDHFNSSCKIVQCIANHGHLHLETADDLTESEGMIDDWLGKRPCSDSQASGEAIESVDGQPSEQLEGK